MGQRRRKNFWTAVEVKHRCDGEAVREIHKQNFQTFAPMYRERSRGGVRAVRYLFDGYVFVFVRVSDGQRWKSLSGTRGVKRVMLWGDEPARILQADIDRISAGIAEDGYYRIDSEEPPVFPFGQRVMPQSGMFGGQQGKHLGPVKPGRFDRVKVLFEMFGRAIESECLATDLVAV